MAYQVGHVDFRGWRDHLLLGFFLLALGCHFLTLHPLLLLECCQVVHALLLFTVLLCLVLLLKLQALFSAQVHLPVQVAHEARACIALASLGPTTFKMVAEAFDLEYLLTVGACFGPKLAYFFMSAELIFLG